MRFSTFIFFIAINLFFFSNGNSQTLPFTYDYHFNSYLINPAAAGYNVRGMSVRLIDRQQWFGVPGAPQTGSFSLTSFVGKSHGIGVVIGRDVVGLQQRLMGRVSYSHHALVDKVGNRHMAFGLAAEVFQFSMANSFVDPIAQMDRGLTAGVQQKIYPNATGGILFYGDRGHFGVSVFNLIKPELASDFEPSVAYISIGRKERLISDMVFEFNYLAKLTFDFDFEMDVNAYLSFGNKFWIGASYRTPASIIAMTGFNKGAYSFGYAFEYSLTAIMPSSFGTHSVMIGYNIFKSRNGRNEDGMIECPAYF